MKEVIVRNLDNKIISNNNVYEDPTEFLILNKKHNTWGAKEQKWVRAKLTDEVTGETIYPDEYYQDEDIIGSKVEIENEVEVNYALIDGDYTIEIKDYKRVPKEVTMRQARVALIRAGLYDVVNTAIQNSDNEELKVDWEYSQVVQRDWVSLNALVQSLGMTQDDVDNLFILAETL